MNFARHYDKEGKHAVLSPSTWRWINDDKDALLRRLSSQYAQTIGTILHAMAYKHIKYRIKMSKFDKKHIMLELLSNGVPGYVVNQYDLDSIFENLMAYVNDGIGFNMTPEVVLYYTDNFFGTADSIAYNEKTKTLRIHDYKSGVVPAHMEQLGIYAALFCLEYRIKPYEIAETELRIYQNGEILFHNPTADEIKDFADKIIAHDTFINQLRQEG